MFTEDFFHDYDETKLTLNANSDNIYVISLTKNYETKMRLIIFNNLNIQNVSIFT